MRPATVFDVLLAVHALAGMNMLFHVQPQDGDLVDFGLVILGPISWAWLCWRVWRT